MNSDKYLDVIQRKVIPRMRETFPEGGGIFSARSCSLPCIKKVKKFFKKQNGNVLQWPDNLPDHYPIEYLLSIIKYLLQKLDCKTMTKLIEAIVQVWYQDQKTKKTMKNWWNPSQMKFQRIKEDIILTETTFLQCLRLRKWKNLKFGIFYTLSQLIWTRLKTRKSIILKLASRMHKMRIFSVILQNFPGGMNSDLPTVVVPSALPLKLICDVTRFWWHFVLPLEIFCIHHWMYLFSVDQPHFVYYQRC